MPLATRISAGGNGDGSENLLYPGRLNIRDSSASACLADFTGLASGNRRLDSTDVGELDRFRHPRSLELFRITSSHESLIGFE